MKLQTELWNSRAEFDPDVDALEAELHAIGDQAKLDLWQRVKIASADMLDNEDLLEAAKQRVAAATDRVKKATAHLRTLRPKVTFAQIWQEMRDTN
jgi:hypothetical protein